MASQASTVSSAKIWCALSSLARLADGYGFMGHIEPPHVQTLLARTAPEVAGRLKQQRVDCVLLTPA